jgi:hypothetical protein
MVWLFACLVDGGLYRERRAALTDDDGDKWTEDAGDCDDADATVHPKAPEACNHLDDDCDGAVDENAPTWFLDDDHDGYGDAATAVATCDAPGGFVDNEDDCDDENTDIHPDALETCDGVDDDCDSHVDDDDDDLTGGIALFTDGDRDGFGDDGTAWIGCAVEKGTIDMGGDCDDDDAAIHPGAAPEICEDGVDTNCDGVGLGCTGSAADADAAFFGEATGDEASMVTASGVDYNADGYTDLVIGARSNDNAGSDAGAAYVILGPVANGSQSLATAWTKLRGAAAGDKAGRAVAFAGDLDGDGIEDIAVSAPLHNAPDVAAGSVYLVSASDIAPGSTSVDSVAWAEIAGDHQFDYCGTAIISAHDESGDGVDDLWIGASGTDSGGDTETGSVFLVLGPLTGGKSVVGSHRAELTGFGDATSDVGTVLAAGDYNGDGLTDVAIGNRYEFAPGYLSGAVFLVAGPASGSVSLGAADATLRPNGAGDAFGTSVSSDGDINGDGREDLVVGAPGANGTGEAYLFLGVSAITALSGNALALASQTYVSGAGDVTDVGSGVAVGGDFDDDGLSDTLIGASGSGKLGQGAAFLVTGPTLGGTVALDEGGGRVALRLDGKEANDALGSYVAFTGAVAGDANQGLLVSSSTLNTTATATGGSYLIWDVGF